MPDLAKYARFCQIHPHLQKAKGQKLFWILNLPDLGAIYLKIWKWDFDYTFNFCFSVQFQIEPDSGSFRLKAISSGTIPALRPPDHHLLVSGASELQVMPPRLP